MCLVTVFVIYKQKTKICCKIRLVHEQNKNEKKQSKEQNRE